MFDALFGKLAIQTGIKFPYSDDALLCIFLLGSRTNSGFQLDGFLSFLKNFFAISFQLGPIVQWCTVTRRGCERARLA